MALLRTERTSLRSFGALISPMVDSLSLGRARIVVEQIRRNGQSERLILLQTSQLTESPAPSDQCDDQVDREIQNGAQPVPLAACVAILQRGAEPDSISDVATVVHAGSFVDLDPELKKEVIASLSEELDRQLRDHRVTFVQWATDAIGPESAATHSPGSPSDWCQSFGFEPIGTLDYLCGSVPEDRNEPFATRGDSALNFRTLDWNSPPAWEAWVELVDSTYTHTLDCPGLSKFRTTPQVLEGYQLSETFQPSLWLIAADGAGNDVGCAIFAVHESADRSQAESNDRIDSVEIVYMGLSSQSRGNAYGQQLVRQAFEVARTLGAAQVILAVDQINEPAKSIYARAGLSAIIKETVWVKSLDQQTHESKED